MQSPKVRGWRALGVKLSSLYRTGTMCDVPPRRSRLRPGWPWPHRHARRRHYGSAACDGGALGYLHQFGQHVFGCDEARIIVVDMCHSGDVADQANRCAADLTGSSRDVVRHRENPRGLLINKEVFEPTLFGVSSGASRRFLAPSTLIFISPSGLMQPCCSPGMALNKQFCEINCTFERNRPIHAAA
jgi:hypothetical protein